MKRYYIEIAYDGSNFSGYQIQPGLRTVQEELEKALRKINNDQTVVTHASGRTDKGVHAYKQTVHFDLSITISEIKLVRALNSNLPSDIHVNFACEVDSDFHARYMVISKSYVYKLNLGTFNPMERNYVYQCCHHLDIRRMKKAIKYLIGTHDFRSFVSENKEKENCVRTITNAYIKRDRNNRDQYNIYFVGTGFLKYQVRNMVGLLIKIGEGKVEPRDMKRILSSCDRNQAGKTAPAEGLYLLDVTYDEKCFLKS